MQLFKRISRAQVGVIELLAVAIVLACGVNLIANAVGMWLGTELSVLIGLAVVVGLFIVVLIARFRRMSESVRIEGFIPLFDNELVEVDDYGLSDRLTRALTAALKENKALAKQWEDDPLIFPRETSKEQRRDRHNFDGAGARILRESLEFVLLEELSMHLSEYFSRESGLAAHTEEYTRDDLHPLLSQNRVLNLLTSPLEDRIALLEAQDKNSSGGHFVRVMRVIETPQGIEEKLYSAGNNEFMYRRVELQLPTNTIIQRNAPGHISLINTFIESELVVDFKGYGANLDREFISGYLRLPPHEFYGHGDSRGSCFLVHFQFNTRLKWRSLLSSRGWRLQRWTEAFAESIMAKFDREAFFEEIHWPTVRTLVRIRRADEFHRDALNGHPRSVEGTEDQVKRRGSDSKPRGPEARA